MFNVRYNCPKTGKLYAIKWRLQSKSFTSHLTPRHPRIHFKTVSVGFINVPSRWTGKTQRTTEFGVPYIKRLLHFYEKFSVSHAKQKKNNKTGKGMTSKITALPCHMRRGKLAPA